jgi:hypothetical protein
MKEPLEKITIGDYKTQNGVTIAVYEEFVTVTVFLSSNDSLLAIMKGGVNAERQALSKFLRDIFDEEKGNLKTFDSAIQFDRLKSSLLFKVPDLSNGGWSKTAIFLLDTNNFEKSLESTINYIKGKYNDYLNPKAKQVSIAKNILHKHFKDTKAKEGITIREMSMLLNKPEIKKSENNSISETPKTPQSSTYDDNKNAEREAIEHVKRERMTPAAHNSDNMFVRLEAQRNAQDNSFAEREREAQRITQVLERENLGAGKRYMVQRDLELLPDSMFKQMCYEANINPEPRNHAISKLTDIFVKSM